VKVVYIGNFEPSHSTENDVRLAFEHLGWEVDLLQEGAFTRAFSDASFGFVYDRCLAADLVLHTMTQGSYPDPERVLDLWRACKRQGIPTASIHLDLFYGLASRKDTGPQRFDLPREHPMFKVEYVFTADGGHQAEFARDGVNHFWSPPALRHTEAIDVDPGPTTVYGHDGSPIVIEPGQYDVGFAGSDGYHPEWQHRPQLVAWLRQTYGNRFLHIGGSATRRVVGLDLNRLYASVPVWVGDSCLTRPDFAYWSDRVPETWGRGGFLIHPHVEALDARYDERHPGCTWEAGDWNGLHWAVEGGLADRDNTDGIRRRFARRTRAHDTYVQRVEAMLATIGLTVVADES
jgi:hypothetical protein